MFDIKNRADMVRMFPTSADCRGGKKQLEEELVAIETRKSAGKARPDDDESANKIIMQMSKLDKREEELEVTEAAAKIQREKFAASRRGNQAATSGVRDCFFDDPSGGYESETIVGSFMADVMAASTDSTVRPSDTFIQWNQKADQKVRFDAAATGTSFGDGASLGFLSPPEFSNVIWDGLNDGADSLLSLTDNHVVSGESLTFPANAETSRADGSRYGGVRGYWLAEADQITHSKPKVRRVKIEPQELAVLVYATDKLLGNASTAENYVRKAATDEINFMVGDAVINGDGVGKPAGLLNSGSLVTVTRDTASEFRQADVAAMWARLHARMMPGAVWLINQTVLPQLLQMMTLVRNDADNDSVGGFNARLYDPSVGQYGALMGKPVIIHEGCAALGTTGDVILCDPGSYAVGTRGGIDSAMSIHLRFDYSETAFRFRLHVDGQSWMNSALTPFKGASTLSNIIVLS